MKYPIDDILSELSKQDQNLILFCGAGISINSAIPTVVPLLNKTLDLLEMEAEDKVKLVSNDGKLAIPFEMFFDIFLENTNEHQILNIFKDGEPSTTHFFALKCCQLNIVNEVYTTNFDLLIEKAFEVGHVSLEVLRNESSFSKIETSLSKYRLIKIHGSIDDLESIRTTLRTIANQQLSKDREKIIERVFGTKDGAKRVLILGYSCSDVFDIIPKIEKIFKPKVKVFLVEHNKIADKGSVIIESIKGKPSDNPFKKFKGLSIKVDTDEFIKWFWENIDTDYHSVISHNSLWVNHVSDWVSSFHSPYLKSSIIGQIFYRIGNYGAALKYHDKALAVSKDKRDKGEGASYSNIGLIYHDLKDYNKAIFHYEKANGIFNDIHYTFGIVATYTNMGYAYIYLPNKIKAILNLKKALGICRNTDFREKRVCESDALCNLGLLYEKSGEYSNAVYYYSLTLEIDKEGNKHGEANTLSDLARVYKLLGKSEESIKLFKKSNDLALKLGIQTLINYTTDQLTELSKKA